MKESKLGAHELSGLHPGNKYPVIPNQNAYSGRKPWLLYKNRWGILKNIYFITAALLILLMTGCESGNPSLSVMRSDRVAEAAALSPDGADLAIAWDGGHIEVTDSNTVAVHRNSWTMDKDFVKAICFSRSGRELLFARADALELLKADNGDRLFLVPLSGELNDIVGDGGIALLPDGLRCLTCGVSSVRLWDLRSGKVLRQWDVSSPGPFFVGMSLSPDGRLFTAYTFYGGGGTGAIIGEVESGKAVPLARDGHTVTATAFSPSGHKLVVAEQDTVMKREFKLQALTDVPVESRNGPEWLYIYDAPERLVNADSIDTGVPRIFSGRGDTDFLALSPDESAVATAGKDGSFRIWSVPLGRVVQDVATGHVKAERRALQFRSNNQALLVAVEDRNALVWSFQVQH